MFSEKDLETLYFNTDFTCLKLDTQFDIALLKNIHNANCLKVEPRIKDKNLEYVGYCLQSDVDCNPYYGCIDTTRRHRNNDHTYDQIADFYFHKKKNELGHSFKYIYDRFEVHLYQGRVLIAKPGCHIPLHNDGAFRLTLHVPIETNSDSYFNVNDQKVHMPADGSSYLLNTRLMHEVFNQGHEDRIHVVFCLWPICVKNPSDEFRNKYESFYDKAKAYDY